MIVDLYIIIHLGAVESLFAKPSVLRDSMYKIKYYLHYHLFMMIFLFEEYLFSNINSFVNLSYITRLQLFVFIMAQCSFSTPFKDCMPNLPQILFLSFFVIISFSDVSSIYFPYISSKFIS